MHEGGIEFQAALALSVLYSCVKYTIQCHIRSLHDRVAIAPNAHSTDSTQPLQRVLRGSLPLQRNYSM